MDDSCAVCAETLEWVAYGPCGHREVCSTCVARLRFICNDRRCCLCKTESDIVFVTKALGDYTRVINDFSVLPFELMEGRVGPYWYHEDTQSLFDDLEHYKMIKAMCRLSCSVCDKMEAHPNDGSKRRGRFRNMEQLKGHLHHQHRLLMCSLCLEGRKVFICEQKLYTRAQLNQHINTGDSEVDGTESERGGFMGHPMCEFCRTPFYGDNELYSHMSTEHYTCHICQRQHPGQYEYYKNYDDLEVHFHREHFLCEDEACLAKKFIVFQSEAELKRHNTLEHGGRMSRSKRNAALQIPTSFRYRRSNDQDNRHGRGRVFHRDSSGNQLSRAIQASLETARAERLDHDPSSSQTQAISDHEETSDIDLIIQPFESLTATDAEPSSRYLQALSLNSRNKTLEETSFPPLPLAPGSQQKTKHEAEGLLKDSMAAHLRRKSNRNVNISSAAQAWPSASRGSKQPSVSPVHTGPTTDGASGSSSSSGENCLGTDNGPAPSSIQTWPAASRGSVPPAVSSIHSKPALDNGAGPANYSSLAQARPTSVHESSPSGLAKRLGSSSQISHSLSAPNLFSSGPLESSASDFPPVCALQDHKLPVGGQTVLKVEDVHTANKSLVERIRTALEFDEDKYAVFKNISGEYRQGLMDAGAYLAYVQQFGLPHLVIELARLCPDADKQRELIETYNANFPSGGHQENGWSRGGFGLDDNRDSKKGKGKHVDAKGGGSKDRLAENIIDTVRRLQSGCKPSEEMVEVLSKDGYRGAKGKPKLEIDEPHTEISLYSRPSVKLNDQFDTLSTGGGPTQGLGERDGKSKQRKKTSKFHRVRLGDGSVAVLLDHRNSDPEPDLAPDLVEAASDENKPAESLPVRGVWKNGGGRRLLAMTAKVPQK